MLSHESAKLAIERDVLCEYVVLASLKERENKSQKWQKSQQKLGAVDIYPTALASTFLA